MRQGYADLQNAEDDWAYEAAYQSEEHSPDELTTAPDQSRRALSVASQDPPSPRATSKSTQAQGNKKANPWVTRAPTYRDEKVCSYAIIQLVTH